MCSDTAHQNTRDTQGEMMQLDLLQNAPLNKERNLALLDRRTQNLPAVNPAVFKHNQSSIDALAALFGAEGGGDFGFASGDFVELFLRLRAMGGKNQDGVKSGVKIGFALSNTYQAYEAYRLTMEFCDFVPIVPDREEGIIKDLCSLPPCDIYCIPYINQDLLTRNPLQELRQQIRQQNPQALCIIDLSYALAWGEEIPIPWDEKIVFLCDGESLGFLRGHGVFLGSCGDFFPRTRYVDGLYDSLGEEILHRRGGKGEDEKERVFGALQGLLGEDVGLFAPLSFCLPNTLPLRLRGIKARNLLQSLYLEGISAINGQRCLLGLGLPSLVLEVMGYEESSCRELLSLSFASFPSELVSRFALHYQQIKYLEL